MRRYAGSLFSARSFPILISDVTSAIQGNEEAGTGTGRSCCVKEYFITSDALALELRHGLKFSLLSFGGSPIGRESGAGYKDALTLFELDVSNRPHHQSQIP